MSPQKEAILSFLNQEDRPLKVTKIAAELRLWHEDTYKILKELKNKGLVVYDRQCHGWRITPKG